MRANTVLAAGIALALLGGAVASDGGTGPAGATAAPRPRASAAQPRQALHDLVAGERSRIMSLERRFALGQMRWDDVGGRLFFQRGGAWQMVDLVAGARPVAADDALVPPGPPRAAPSGRRPARGRQRASEPSPCGTFLATCRDDNVIVQRVDGNEEFFRTTDGGGGIAYGRASWVYGEELNQVDAMWWSPDARFLAFYRFDERHVTPYRLPRGWTGRFIMFEEERYPKSGDRNPTVGLHVLSMETGETHVVDVHALADPAEPEWYIYRVQWAPSPGEGDAPPRLLFSRTTRLQRNLEVVSWDPLAQTASIVVTASQPAGWQENRPLLRFLDDGRRFLFGSDETGFRRIELRDLDGGCHAIYEVPGADIDAVERIDTDAGLLWFSAWDPEDPLVRHIWRAPLPGRDTGDAGAPHRRPDRWTEAPRRHDITFSPDGRFLVVTAQSPEHPPVVTLCAADGTRIAQLSPPEDHDAGAERPVRPSPRRFRVPAADGTTMLDAVLYPPSRGDDGAAPIPVMLQVYGGPDSRALTGRYRAGHAYGALGWAVVQIDNRGTTGRGRDFLTAGYGRLGAVDVDDQAAAMRALLAMEPRLDPARVGVAGHSYGGYMAIMLLLRHPGLFAAGVAASPVTDWRQYDTIYTERYMGLPDDNPEGYSEGSAVVQAHRLADPLLLLHGTADDNVHLNQTLELVHVLHQKNLRFDLMLYPESGHGLPAHAEQLRVEYLARYLGAPGVSAEAGGIARPE
ncbi:MAG: S9 family peptidase [Phycisphaeraceae bacterium]|nr:S9 family peptidase [Phycisphaeraceae bacterium]